MTRMKLCHCSSVQREKPKKRYVILYKINCKSFLNSKKSGTLKTELFENTYFWDVASKLFLVVLSDM